MKVYFFDQPYLLYVSDLHKIPARENLHVIRKIQLGKNRRLILILGREYLAFACMVDKGKIGDDS